VGSLKYFEENGSVAKAQDLYDNSMFFKTLLENSMMSMASFFRSNTYKKYDPEFGNFGKLYMMSFRNKASFIERS
jgi:phosphoenolpyruvate carboxylase